MGEVSNIKTKKFGVGTWSLIITIFSIIFSFSSLGNESIGEIILNAIGVKLPVGIISTVLFVISIFIGHKYKEDFGAKSGKYISIFFLGVIIILTVMNLIR